MHKSSPKPLTARSGNVSTNALRPKEPSRNTMFRTCVVVISVKSRTRLLF